MDKTKSGVSLLGKLILLELILSVIFVVLGHFVGSAYFRGVGVGLIISWVTSVLAYFIDTERRKKKGRLGVEKVNEKADGLFRLRSEVFTRGVAL